MFTLSHTTKINLHKEPVDIRLGVYSLQGLIADSGSSVREGALYAFTNLPRTLPRMVLFDGTGLYVHQAAGEGYVQLTAHS